MTSSSSPPSGSPAPRSYAVTSPSDILSYVPHALGFMPEESLVVLTTSARRLGATLRVDLPRDGADALVFARGVLSFLRGDADADGTLVIVYAGQDWYRRLPPPHADMVLILEAVLAAAGLPIRAGWHVSREWWRDYFCRDEDCCPWPGEPLDAVTDSALNAELVYGGSAFDASAPQAVVRATPALGIRSTVTRQVLSDVEDARAQVAACCAGHWTDEDQFGATSAVWDGVLESPRGIDVGVDRDLAGFLLAGVESRTVRDHLLVSACLGSAAGLRGARGCGLLRASDELRDGAGHAASLASSAGPGAAGIPPGVALADALRWSLGSVLAPPGRTCPVSLERTPQTPPAVDDPGEAALLYADLLAGRYAGTIEWARVDAMTRVLGQLATVAAGESRAAVLTMTAWFEYARGRGSRAAVYLDAAEQALPGYRLALLLHELLRRGGMPAWARKRATAWTAREGLGSRTAA